MGGWGGKKEKNYKDYSHLGLGRHKLPHEDRGILASLVLEKIFEDTGIKIPNMAVASWKEPTCNAFFYLLAHAQPSLRLQQMVPQGDQFSLESAAEGLFAMWQVFVRDPEQRKVWANEFLSWCIRSEDKVVEEAMRKGMERDIGGGVSPASGVRGLPPAPGPCGTSSHSRTRVLLRTQRKSISV